ncbi:hydrogenase expression/formation C-terminal domain-containing protein [Methylacidiphilum caldifontis]|uniref:HupH hydrogenase expression protein C-terminal domain-containing protein n=1 Tax=Methylacidiphilum caldifontis TaxID=2795386 RepID=A0A4Y8PH38_9BACT|nr:hydrogenase expression/formation C-terminal domain-containing protein [Methylacidiphilum caldifontis]QSR88793.1 hypothetical protein IT6_00320 [Methylacidiphilum caldifontis]TFE71560.1 hypothetical protein A7Q10_04505 [Methylacidiphilum caldifontis]
MHKLFEKIYLSFVEQEEGKEPDQIFLDENQALEQLLHFLKGGEVEVVFETNPRLTIVESQICGLWAAFQSGKLKWLEVGNLPKRLIEFQSHLPSISLLSLKELSNLPQDGLMNAPYLLVEMSRLAKVYDFTKASKVIPLSLLPLSLADQQLLNETLGYGKVTIQIKGYGHCLIKNSGYKNLWWVEDFNVEGKSIFKAIEIVSIPSLVMAAKEDMQRGLSKVRKLKESFMDQNSINEVMEKKHE